MRNLSKKQVMDLAEHLETAELQVSAVQNVSDNYLNITRDDAFDIQWEIRNRKEARGVKVVGLRLGLTSRVEMSQLVTDQPCYGFLADYFAVPDGGDIKHDALIHPKIVAELAFVTKAPLQGPGVNIADVLSATDFVMPAVGVLDSRYKDFEFDKISVIADNASSSRFVTGSTISKPEDLDLKTLGVVLEVNGRIVQLGAGAEVLGHPATAVATLANMLAERGEHIPAGTFIMTGGITLPVAVKVGDSFIARYQDLGCVSGRFV